MLATFAYEKEETRQRFGPNTAVTSMFVGLLRSGVWCNLVLPHLMSSRRPHTAMLVLFYLHPFPLLPCSVPNISIRNAPETASPRVPPRLAALTAFHGNPNILPSVCVQGEADEALTCLVQKKDESEL